MSTRRSSRYSHGLAAIALSCALALSCAAPEESGGGRDVPDLDRAVYIVNSQAETLSVLDPSGRKLYRDVLDVGKWPNAVVPWDGRFFVVNSGDNSVQVFRESDYELLETIELGVNRNPWTLIVDPVRRQGFVPNFMAGTVTVIDLDTYGKLGEVDLDPDSSRTSGPEGGCYLDGRVFIGNTAYDSGTDRFGAGFVSVVDAATYAVTKLPLETAEWTTAEQGCNPQSLIAFPALAQVHAVCTGVNGGTGSDDGEVVAIEVPAYGGGAPYVSARISIGGSPVVSADGADMATGRVYLAGVGGVMAYARSPFAVERGSSNYYYAGGASDFFSGACYDSETGLLVVTDYGADRVLLIDTVTGTLFDSFAGSDGPQTPALFVK